MAGHSFYSQIIPSVCELIMKSLHLTDLDLDGFPEDSPFTCTAVLVFMCHK